MTIRKTYHCVLTIAGSDSSGGAGIQADLKTISALGGYAASVITALTAQNTQGVVSIHSVPANFINAQLETVFSDIDFSAVKIGMLHRPDIIQTVAAQLKKWQIHNVVLDPVMVAKGGCRLMTEEAIAALQLLFPQVALLTPNIPEAQVLLQRNINNLQQMKTATYDLATRYQTNVIIKGGHLIGKYSHDVLYDYINRTYEVYRAVRVATHNTHGTGCTFSAAIATYLAQGFTIKHAIAKAKDYINNALKSGSYYRLGQGCGPVDHYYPIRNEVHV